MTKAPTPTEMSKGQWQHKQRHKKFDYTAIADLLRTVSWSYVSHPTAMVNRFTGPPSHFPQQPCNQKDTNLKKKKDKPPYIDKKPTVTPSGEVLKINTQTT